MHNSHTDIVPFSNKLSQIILQVFADNDMNDEDLLTFAFYLQLGLVNVMTSIDPNFTNALKRFASESKQAVDINQDDDLPFNGEMRDMSQEEADAMDNMLIDKLYINEKFEQNKEILFEIKEDIANAAYQDVPWMRTWVSACKDHIGNYDKGVSLKVVYDDIVKELHHQLESDANDTGILSYFISRILGLMNLPGIIIMGAEKCGTTSLHATLTTHSQIIKPVDPENNRPIKEVNFISHPTRWDKGVDYYLSHFVGNEGFFIDSSPHYISSPYSFERMHYLIPNAKLIVCIREPGKRAYSQYNHYRQILPTSAKWDWGAKSDFLTNIKAELKNINDVINDTERSISSQNIFEGLIARGLYYFQLQKLFEYYDRSQVYITITDRWPVNYEDEINNIQDFLGLKKEMLSQRVANKREYTFEPFCDEAKQLLTDFYKPYNEMLFELLGYDIPEWN